MNRITKRLFIAATQQNDGKTTISLGVFGALRKTQGRIGFIKPVGQRFVEIEELVFGERSSVVLDPGEERIKTEFAGVKRSFLPVQSVVRIDEVRKQGVSKIVALEGSNVAAFPGPVFGTPAGDSGPRK